MGSKDDFLKTHVNWGVIVRGDLATIQRVKELLATIEGLELIYQTTDVAKLRIVRENQGSGGQ